MFPCTDAGGYRRYGYKSGNSPAKFASDLKARFSNKNVVVDYVIYGHKHNPDIGDFFGVSGCLSGGNTYGEFALNKSCRASQNIYVVHTLFLHFKHFKNSKIKQW
jgi:hypothetical protein